jgi:hypothetical protein
MIKTSRALSVALLLAVAAVGCSEEDTPDGSDLRTNLAELRDQIEEAEDAAQRHKAGLLGEMVEMRREVLLLSVAILENRLIANESGVPSKVVAPALLPNPARAEQILRHIAATEDALDKAREDAAEREGMAGSLSQTTVVTQELTLAQLRLAYFQAAYGIALPGQQEAAVGSGRTATAPPAPTAAPAGNVKEVAPITERPESSGAESETTAAPLPPLEAPAEPAPVAEPEPVAELEPPVKAAPAPRTYSRNDYARIQLLLEEAGYKPGPVDGRWGPQTQRALAAFQQSSGLPSSGQPDKTTLDALGFN